MARHEGGEKARHRERLGLSQEGLAYKVDINRTYIASLEAGQRNPSLDLMARLAKTLGIDLSELVKGLQRRGVGRNESVRGRPSTGAGSDGRA